MKEKYKTVKSEASAEFVEKRSRFIATVKPVENEKDAVDFINSLRQKYWDATHNVYAYVIEENNITRYSDDGEPGGTAGMPVLDVLTRNDITNAVVVVTRYFGGTLLGTGGLVHAYSHSAKIGVEASGIAEMVMCRQMTIKCDYTLLGKIQNELRRLDIIEGETQYTDMVEISLYVPLDNIERVKKAIIELTNATAEFVFGDCEYIER